jgi:hypothetical protein
MTQTKQKYGFKHSEKACVTQGNTCPSRACYHATQNSLEKCCDKLQRRRRQRRRQQQRRRRRRRWKQQQPRASSERRNGERGVGHATCGDECETRESWRWFKGGVRKSRGAVCFTSGLYPPSVDHGRKGQGSRLKGAEDGFGAYVTPALHFFGNCVARALYVFLPPVPYFRRAASDGYRLQSLAAGARRRNGPRARLRSS